MRWSLWLLGLGGFAAAVWMVVDIGVGDVASALAAIGWGALLVLAFRALPLWCDAAGWRVLFARGARPPMGVTWWVRWISESVNALLPVAQIGGEVVRAHLISRSSVVPRPAIGTGEATATVIVDMTTGLIATALFSLTGLVLLLGRHADVDVTGAVWWALGGLALMTGGFVAAQRSGLVTRAVRAVAVRLAQGRAGAFVAEMNTLDRAFERMWADHGAILASAGWRFASFLAGAAEVWLVLLLLGHPVGWDDALMLEALSTAARSAAFAIPGGLGVQEGSLLVLGQLVGLDASTALALALVKRLREVVTGLPALALWWWVGARRPMAGVEPARADAPTA